MNLVLCTDANMLIGLAGTLSSCLRHLPPTQPVHIYLMLYDVSELSKAKLRRRFAGANRELTLIDVPSSSLEGLPSRENLPRTTFLRLWMDRMLPTSVGRVIYLDCDLLIRCDVTELWQVPLGTNIAAGVVDYGNPTFADGFPYRAIDDEDRQRVYINAGVMLIDLKQWRAANVSNHVIDYTRKHLAHLRFGDQDGINAVLAESRTTLDWSYNVQVGALDFHRRQRWAKDTLGLRQRYGQLIALPKIVHYVGGGKPWSAHWRVPRRPEFFGSLAHSGWLRRHEALRHLAAAWIRGATGALRRRCKWA